MFVKNTWRLINFEPAHKLKRYKIESQLFYPVHPVLFTIDIISENEVVNKLVVELREN